MSKDGRTFAGGVILDGNEEIVAASGEKDSKLYDNHIDKSITEIGDQFSGLLQGILSGNDQAFTMLDEANRLHKEGKMADNEYDAFLWTYAGSLSGGLGVFRSDNENQNWGTGARVDVGMLGAVEINTGKQVAGFIAQVLSVASAGGQLSAEGHLDIHRQDNSESRQNVNATEIYELLKESEGNTEIMTNSVQEYTHKKMTENLSGMGVTADVISDGLDMMKNMGYTANIKVVKDPETGKPGIEVNKNWENEK